MHGHKLGRGVDSRTLSVLGEQTFAADLAAIKSLDDRRERKKVVDRAHRLAAELFGAKQSFFLVNGSFLSVQAALLAIAGPDEEVLVGRNVHRSVAAGLILGGQRPVFMAPDFDDERAIAHPVTSETMRAALDAHPAAKGVMVVSPSYYGVSADLAGQARACHEHAIPFAVDDAWGVHFGFHPDLPESPIAAGADLSIGSVHKTVGGLAPASILSVQGDLVDVEALQQRIDLLETTSPSVPVLASIDGWRRAMALDGEATMTRVLELARRARKEIGEIDGLTVMGEEVLDRPGACGLDETKIVVDVSALPVTGFTAWDYLDREHHVLLELEDHRRLVAIVTPADDDATIDRLVAALRSCARWAEGQPVEPVDLPRPSELQTELAMTPRQAFFADTVQVPLSNAVGLIAAEMASPYPPGVPIVLPGERITQAIVDYLGEVVRATALIPDARDPELKQILVVR